MTKIFYPVVDARDAKEWQCKDKDCATINFESLNFRDDGTISSPITTIQCAGCKKLYQMSLECQLDMESEWVVVDEPVEEEENDDDD